MAFKRDELLSLSGASKERFQEVVQTLLQQLHDGNDLTLAEGKYICLGLRTIYDVNDKVAFSAKDFSQCGDFLFWEKYLLYWGDHEGWGRIKNSSNTFVSDAQKSEDVKFLNDHYEEWKHVVWAEQQKTAFLQTVVSETRRLIKEVTEYSKQIGEGANRQRYIEKALTLHSKYVYFQVREYYEELDANEELMAFCNEKVVIDFFAYIHILFGHFAAGIKFQRPGKSYHSNDTIDFRRIPKNIISILTEYSDQGLCHHFNKQNIFFNLKQKNYAIWFRSMTRSVKGKGQENYLRVQTFYPIELAEDISKLQKLELLKVNNDLSFYVPK